MILTEDVRALLKQGVRARPQPSGTPEPMQALRSLMEQASRSMESAEGEALGKSRSTLFEAAVEGFRRALEQAPNYTPALALMGTCLGDLAEMESDPPRRVELRSRQLDAYREVVSASPDDPALWMAIGIALGDLANLQSDSARQHTRSDELGAYRHAVQSAPKNALARLLLGSRLAQEGAEADEAVSALRCLMEAVEQLRVAVSLAPDQPMAWTTLGGALLHLFHRSPSQELLSEAASAADRGAKEGGGVYNRACARALLGSYQEAIEDLRTALSKREVTPEHVKRDSDWKGLRGHPEFESALAGAPRNPTRTGPDDLIKFLRQRTPTDDAVRWQKTNEEWVEALRVLFAGIEEWLRPVVDSKEIYPLQWLSIEIQEGESDSPPYVAPVLRLLTTRAGVSVLVVPRARRVVAATGRVDMVREPAGRSKVLVRFREAPPEWYFMEKGEDGSWESAGSPFHSISSP